MESENLAEELIFRIIKENGYITVDKLMSISNHYYYNSPISIGSDGDFTTSPEISQMFGEMIGIWAFMQWEKLGFPNPVAILELGPGRGTLMRDILRATKNLDGFHSSAQIKFLEFSDHLIEIQKHTIAEYNLSKEWINSLDNLPNIPTIIIANEFFDALPVKQYIHNNGAWKEVRVKFSEDGNLTFCYENQDTHPIIFEESPLSLEIAKKISEHISQNSGAAIIVDYGYDSVCCCHSCECRNPGVTKCHEVAHYHLDPGSRLAGLLALDDIVCRCCHSCEGRNPGITKSHEVAHYNSTLQAIKNHKFHNVLDSIGKADLSCHVDFWALKRSILNNSSGLLIAYTMTQSELLKELGIELRLKNLIKLNPELSELLIKQYERLTSKSQMGELFKAMIVETPTQ